MVHGHTGLEVKGWDQRQRHMRNSQGDENVPCLDGGAMTI